MPINIGPISLPTPRELADATSAKFDELGEDASNAALMKMVNTFLPRRADQVDRFDVVDNGRTRQATLAMTGVMGKEAAPSFRAELQQLAPRPEVKAFLRDVIAGLKPGVDFDLWATALKHTGGDEREALKWIAVLLQDTRKDTAEGVAVEAHEPETAGLLREVQSAVRNADLTGKRLYPPGVESDRTVLYHFYVMAYVSQRLKDQGFSSAEAFLPSAMINNEYEMVTLGSRADVSVWDKAKLFVNAARNPRTTLPPAESPELLDAAMKDLYLGYRGALAGSGSPVAPKSFDAFTAAVKNNPDAALAEVIEDVAKAG